MSCSSCRSLWGGICLCAGRGRCPAADHEGEISAKLPSERSFAEEYGVAYTTVRHAMAVLRERGIIVTVHGRGTFVTPRGPGSAQP